MWIWWIEGLALAGVVGLMLWVERRSRQGPDAAPDADREDATDGPVPPP